MPVDSGQTSAPRECTYGDLKTCGAEFLRMQPVREAIEDFYVGGYQLADKAGKYIPRLSNEKPASYRLRLKSGSYFNYFAQIVDYFGSALFSQELAIRPAADADDASTPGKQPKSADLYTRFAKNADAHGRSFNEVLHDRIVAALKHKSAWLQVEFPKGESVANRAEEEAKGLGVPYVFELPWDQVIDWDRDEDGELTYVVVRWCQPIKGPPGARRSIIRESFTVWRREVADDDTATVSWACYTIEYPPNQIPPDNKMVLVGNEGTVSFPWIPILELEVPDGLWAGNKLCPMAREHYSRRTTLNAAENRSMVAIPVAKLGAEIPASGEGISSAQQDENRGQDPVGHFHSVGFEVIGSGDTLEFVEPEGKAYAHVAKRIDDLKDEMFRISHQMAASVSNSAGSTRRSGESKKQDRAAEALVLAALGRIVRNFGVRIYETISRARGEDVEWSAHGLDTYDLTDREDLVAEAMQVDTIGINSETFKRTYKYQLAKLLLENADPATLETIRKELDESVSAEAEMDDLESEARKAQLQQPKEPDPKLQQPKANGAKPPQLPQAGGRS